MIGLVGAHRTGKTTLAQAYAKEHGMTFVQTTISGVFEKLGRDPRIEYPIEERVAIQEAILTALEAQWKAGAKRSLYFVSDRTPIDLAAYLLADIQRSTIEESAALAGLVNDYVDRCFAMTNRYFSTILLVQPGIALTPAPGKAPLCPAYIRHLNMVCRGLITDEKLSVCRYVLPPAVVKIKDRIKSLDGAVSRSVDTMAVRQLASGFATLH